MAFFNEFPHTRTYDSDLAWLIDRMKELMTKMDRVDELLAEVQRLIDTLPEEIRRQIQALFDDLVASGYFEQLVNELLRPYIDMRNSVFVSDNQYTNDNDKVNISKLVCNVVGNMAMITLTAKWTEARTMAQLTSLEPYFQGLRNVNGVTFLEWLTAKKNQLLVESDFRPTGVYSYVVSGSGSFGNYSDSQTQIVILPKTLWQAQSVSGTLQGGIQIPRQGVATVGVDYTYSVFMPII